MIFILCIMAFADYGPGSLGPGSAHKPSSLGAVPMFESLVVTLREGVEAALIVAIVLGYLKKIRRPDLAKSAYIGLVAAAAFAVAAGYLFRRFEISEDLWLEGWGMLIASIFVATMVIWMWRTASRLKGEIENRISHAASNASAGFSFGVFIFVFLVVAR